jgi:hypothetical protein
MDIPGSFLGNGPVNTSPSLGSRFLKMQQLTATMEELCFLRGPFQEVVSEMRFAV